MTSFAPPLEEQVKHERTGGWLQVVEVPERTSRNFCDRSQYFLHLKAQPHERLMLMESSLQGTGKT
jgi:hypothetical protein